MANLLTQHVTERGEGEEQPSEENLPPSFLMEVAPPPLTDMKEAEEAASLQPPLLSEKD